MDKKQKLSKRLLALLLACTMLPWSSVPTRAATQEAPVLSEYTTDDASETTDTDGAETPEQEGENEAAAADPEENVQDDTTAAQDPADDAQDAEEGTTVGEEAADDQQMEDAVMPATLETRAGVKNLALRATATASSYETANTAPGKVNDGNLNTWWGTGQNKATNEYIQLSWSEEQTIQQINIIFERTDEGQNIIRYKVEKVDGENTEVLYEKDSTNRAKQEEVIALENPVMASAIKLTILEADGGTLNWVNVGIREIGVYSETGDFEFKSIEDVKALIQNNQMIAKGTEEFPWDSILSGNVPNGFSIEINGADFEQIIANDGKIHHPLTDKTVKVSYKITDEEAETSVITDDYTYTVEGLYPQASGRNAKPSVIPEIQEWYTESTEKLAESTITKVTYDNDSLIDIVNEFIEDYKDFSGRTLTKEKVSESQANAFNFSTDITSDKLLGDEGYNMEITSDRINVASESIVGNMYGMQTILQMYKSDATGYAIGQMRDYPRFQVRGFVFDVARKPVSMEMIKEVARTMRYYKMNDFQVHLSDNYIWLEDYGKLENENLAFQAYDAFRLESSLTNDDGDSPTAQDYAFSKQEFRTFIQEQRAVGVNIVPEIDVPAHANSFTKVWKELMVQQQISSTAANRPLIDHLDVSKTETIEKVKEVFDDYTKANGDVPATFDSDTTVHIGADEFLSNYSAYRNFINEIVPYVKQTNTVRMWGGLTWIKDNPLTEIKAEAIEGVEMNLWSCNWADGIEMYNMGYKLINTIDDYGYMVPDGALTRENSYGDLLNTTRIFNSFEPNLLRTNNSGSYQYIPSGDDQALGAAFAIWNDYIDKKASGLSESDLYWRFFDALPFYAEKTWAATGKEKGSADALSSLAETMGTGPNTNPYYQETSVGAVYESYDFDSGNGLSDGSENERNLTLPSDSTAKVIDNALSLKGGKSYVTTPIEKLGNNNSLSFDITLTEAAEPGDIIFESDAPYGTHDIRIMEDGKLGFTRELYSYYFDYTIPVGTKVNIKIVTAQQVTKLYVNGTFVSNATGKFIHNDMEKKTGITNATFALPVQRIGSKTNAITAKIDHVVIKNENFYDKARWTATTNSQTVYNAIEGKVSYAFDNNPSTHWHTNWNGATDKLTGSNSYYAEINFGKKYTINQFSFTPRTDQAACIVTKAELYIKADAGDEWKLVSATGGDVFANDQTKKTFYFDAQEVQYAKFVAYESSDNWVAVSEFDIDYIEASSEPDTPVTPTPTPAEPEMVLNAITANSLSIVDGAIAIDTNDANGVRAYVRGSNLENVVSNDGKVSSYNIGERTVTLIVRVENTSDADDYAEKNVTVTIPDHSGNYPDGFFPKISLFKKQNAKPEVVPTLQEWYGYDGSFELTVDSKIIYNDAANVGLLAAAKNMKADLEEISGLVLTIEQGIAPTSEHDIYIESLNADLYDVGDEGYLLKIDEEGVKIYAPTYTGCLYGTISVEQMLTLSDDQRTVSKGITRDYPAYEVRGLMLDVARTPYRLSQLKDYTKVMLWYKMNEYHLHINDCDNCNTSNANTDYSEMAGFHRLESTTFPSLTSEVKQAGIPSDAVNKDYYLNNEDYQGNPTYTKDEWIELKQICDGMGIDMITEIDLPGHSLLYNKYAEENPDNIDWLEGGIKYISNNINTNGGMELLDLVGANSERALQFAKTLWNEYTEGDTPVISGDVVHIGADEYWDHDTSGIKDAFANFADSLRQTIQSNLGSDTKIRMWGAGKSGKGMFSTAGTVLSDVDLTENYQLDIWSDTYENAKDRAAEGYEIINCRDAYTYGNPGRTKRDVPNAELLFNEWNPTIFGNASDNVLLGEPKLLGAKTVIWGDQSQEGMTEKDIHQRVLRAVSIMSEKTWGSTDESDTFEEFELRAARLAEGPGTTIAMEVESETSLVLDYDFTNISSDGTTVYDTSGNGYDGTLTGEAQVSADGYLTFDGDELTTPLKTLSYPYTAAFSLKLNTSQAAENTTASSIFSGYDGQLQIAGTDDGHLSGNVNYFTRDFEYTVPTDGTEVNIMLVGTFQGTKLYVNGELVTFLSQTSDGDGVLNGAVTSMYSSFLLPLEKIGEGLHAQMKHLQVYNRALSAEEVAAYDTDAWTAAATETNVAQNAAAGSTARPDGEAADTTTRRINVAFKAVDGDAFVEKASRTDKADETTSEMYSYWQGDRKDSALRIDLGKTRTISKVEIQWRYGGKGKSFDIQVSSDNETWKTVKEVRNNGDFFNTVTFTPVEARYVRMQGIESNANSGKTYKIQEFMVYEAVNKGSMDELIAQADTVIEERKIGFETTDPIDQKLWNAAILANAVRGNMTATLADVEAATIALTAALEKEENRPLPPETTDDEDPKMEITISGNDSDGTDNKENTWSSGNLTLQTNLKAIVDLFVYLDGNPKNVVDPKHYTVKNNSSSMLAAVFNSRTADEGVMVIIKESYLKTLDAGEHTLSLMGTNLEKPLEAPVTVEKPTEPDTKPNPDTKPGTPSSNGSGNGNSNGSDHGSKDTVLTDVVTVQDQGMTSASNAPKTGDASNVLLWNILLAACGMTLFGARWKKTRRKIN